MAWNVFQRLCILFPGILTVCVVLAQGLGAGPSTQQLLDVAVGGTQIPKQGKASPVRNPYEGNGAAIAQGEALFHSMNCIGCHAPMGGGGIAPTLSDKTWIYGTEPGHI